MKKRIKMTAVLLMVCTIVCGCGSTIPIMTKEQEEQVVEYAVGLILKYDSNYENKLVDLSLYDKEPVEDIGETPGVAPMDPVQDTEVIEIGEETEGTTTSLNDVLGLLQGVDLAYSGYHFTDSYPENGESDYFTLDATEGKTLLVINYELRNSTAGSQEIDFFDLPVRVISSINGDGNRGALSTMLTDDLLTYVGVLDQQEAVELVVLTEVDKIQTDSVESIDVTFSTPNGQITMTIQ